jgi:FkbM family methyltransferase
MLSRLLVGFYRIVHGKLHLRGSGWLIKQFAPLLPGLQAYPVMVADVGVAVLDFRDAPAFLILNATLGEFGNDAVLIHFLESVLRLGDVLWDVGANVGFISGHFAHPRYQLAAVHAFEPNPAPLKSLQSLLATCPNATVHPFGLGNKDEWLTLNFSPDATGMGTMASPRKEGRKIQVQVRQGDAVRLELRSPPPSVIKIDVEGYEPDVFGGLARTIAEHRPIIVFEHIFLSDEQVKQLAPPACHLYFLMDNGTIATDFPSRMQGHDAALVPDEKSHLFKPESLKEAWSPAPWL